MASNLGFLYLANSTQQTVRVLSHPMPSHLLKHDVQANPAFRISTSIIVMGVLLGLGIISTRVNEIEPMCVFSFKSSSCSSSSLPPSARSLQA